MRRNWIAVLLFAWALGLKALLPATAGVVHAGSVGLSGKPFAFCVQEQLFGSQSESPAKSAPANSNPHREDCLWCAVSCDGVALPATSAYAGAAFTPWAEASWTQKRAAWSLVRYATSHQPRAPPSFF